MLVLGNIFNRSMSSHYKAWGIEIYYGQYFEYFFLECGRVHSINDQITIGSRLTTFELNNFLDVSISKYVLFLSYYIRLTIIMKRFRKGYPFDCDRA